jgi:propionyl-CoA carboxylase alpha chain
VEIRVYAEDPANNFLPDIGRLQTYIRPQGPGIRVDDGFEQGMDIPIYYDPMIAKLITFAKNRGEAIDRMVRAIDEYQVSGVATTLAFCRFVMQHPAFVSGKFYTNFVSKHYTPQMMDNGVNAEAEIAAALIVRMLLTQKTKDNLQAAEANTNSSKWKKNRL